MTLDLDRLAKLAGMFGSDHLGERAAAAAKAHAMVKAANLTWQDIIGAEQPGKPKRQRRPRPKRERRPSPPPPPQPKQTRDKLLDEKIANLWRHLGIPDISDWERDFIASIREWEGELSPKQRAIVDRLCAKIEAYYARAAA